MKRKKGIKNDKINILIYFFDFVLFFLIGTLLINKDIFNLNNYYYPMPCFDYYFFDEECVDSLVNNNINEYSVSFLGQDIDVCNKKTEYFNQRLYFENNKEKGKNFKIELIGLPKLIHFKTGKNYKILSQIVEQKDYNVFLKGIIIEDMVDSKVLFLGISDYFPNNAINIYSLLDLKISMKQLEKNYKNDFGKRYYNLKIGFEMNENKIELVQGEMKQLNDYSIYLNIAENFKVIFDDLINIGKPLKRNFSFVMYNKE